MNCNFKERVMLIKRLSKLCHTLVAKMLHRYSARYCKLLTHNSKASIKPNRDLLNRSVLIEITEPANNFRRRLVRIVPDPDQISEFPF